MNVNPFRLIAAVCLIAALLLMLFLPFVTIITLDVGLSGVETLQISGWVILPIITTIVLCCVCLAVENRFVSIAALAVGAFVPLITVSIVKGQCAGLIMNVISNMMDLGTVSGFASGIINAALKAGLGVILYLILTLVAAVLVFLSENMNTKTTSTPGIEKDSEDW